VFSTVYLIVSGLILLGPARLRHWRHTFRDRWIGPRPDKARSLVDVESNGYVDEYLEQPVVIIGGDD